MKPASSAFSWLAALRVYAGFFWLVHAVGKLTDPRWAAPGGTCETIVRAMSPNATSAYHVFIVKMVLPNVAVFAHLIALGETLVGVSLLVGLLTRPGGLGGSFLAMNYWLAKGSYASLNGYVGFEFLAMVLSFLNVVLPTAATSGLDGLIFARRRVRA